MSREERVARNEALFREVNEKIKKVNVAVEAPSEADFLCECGDAGCTGPVSVTVGEYERVRRDPRHFLVISGHVLPDVERVIAGNDRFSVVEKTDPEAVAVVVEEDPRS